MTTTQHHYSLLRPISPLENPHSPDLLFSPRDSSMDADPLRLSQFDDPLKTSVPFRGFGYDQDSFRESTSPKLKPFPDYRQLSGSISEISELFKAASVDQQRRNDSFSPDTSTTPSSPSIPACEQDSLPELFNSALRPFHIHYLSGGRLPSSSVLNPRFPPTPVFPTRDSYNTNAGLHCRRFPPGHHLNLHFVELYQLEDELGSGGYGFVMTARHRLSGWEVAVKFIIKSKVPEHGWMEDELLGRLPTEVVLLHSVKHENVVQFVDLFEDNVYFYLVQELHGTPWQTCENDRKFDSMASTPSLSPSLSPSTSEKSLDSFEPSTPPLLPITPNILNSGGQMFGNPSNSQLSSSKSTSTLLTPSRPKMGRRASYDLFECIEQSEEKRLSESQAHHIFSQVVDVVHHLDSLGIAHRDIKDENIVIDDNMKVKLIDLGSACAIDPAKPRPYYTQFFGTAAYASSEILLRKKYQAAPAEMWTLGILLSYLLTGTSPFPSVRDAITGTIVMSEIPGVKLSEEVMDVMRRCLDPEPETRMTIQQLKEHPWLASQALFHV